MTYVYLEQVSSFLATCTITCQSLPSNFHPTSAKSENVLIFYAAAFGFCEYAEPDSTLRALRLLHDRKLGDKPLVVCSAWAGVCIAKLYILLLGESRCKDS